MTMTSHERIMRIFRNEEVDRPALKLWGTELSDHLLHPDYAPVRELALKNTDLFCNAGSPFNIFFGRNAGQVIETKNVPVAETWQDRHAWFHTPKGDLHQLERVSTIGEPGYILEYAVKEPEDIEKLLSVPYEPYDFDPSRFEETARRVGDRGVAMFALDHPGYAAQRMMGSETIAYFSVDERELLHEMIEIYAGRVRAHANEAIRHGIVAPFSWVGPELLIPPLMTHADFREFVFDMGKPVCDDIHNAGGYVWVHCHGRVAKLIQDYIDMGVDILNPLEPPKNGDVELDEVVAKFGRSIGWEGNIEIQTLLQADEETVRAEIRRCAEVGKKVNRFVLCPSAGYNEYVFPEKQYLNNLMTYLTYGLECLES